MNTFEPNQNRLSYISAFHLKFHHIIQSDDVTEELKPANMSQVIM